MSVLTDKKTGAWIGVRVAYKGGKISLYGFGPQKYQMLALAEHARAIMRQRALSGIGSDDDPMPRLVTKYRGRRRFSKSRQVWVEYGSKDIPMGWEIQSNPSRIRDLWGTGEKLQSKWIEGKGRVWSKIYIPGSRMTVGGAHMLDAMRVTSASANRAVISITTQDARLKARANEARSPWWGLSPGNVVELNRMVPQLFRQNVEALKLNFAVALNGGGQRRVALPIWLDPLGLKNSGGMAPAMSQARAQRAYASVAARYGWQR